MARTDNITLYECDRCHYKEYLAGNHQNTTSNWRDIHYYDYMGTDTGALLCARCFTAYKELAQTRDTEYYAFILNRSK